MSNLILKYFKVVLITSLVTCSFFLIFTPLNVILPPYFQEMIPQYYLQYDLYYILTTEHIELVAMLLILSAIIFGLIAAWKVM